MLIQEKGQKEKIKRKRENEKFSELLLCSSTDMSYVSRKLQKEKMKEK